MADLVSLIEGEESPLSFHALLPLKRFNVKTAGSVLPTEQVFVLALGD